ncbi:MalM family protein [Tolumonas lignilytica]|uniref:MalM family protein n=1 Tax=Tolumonas lignilytica TaxID=1283284 RepID=UPI000466ED89|nr:MalM family protein [Tolumonas lignilytica]
MKLMSSIALAVCISLAGCSSFSSAISGPTALKQIANANDANSSLRLATVCCKQYSEIKYKDFSTIKDDDEVIDQKNDTYLFPDGKSYFSAYKLPANKGSFRITLSSLFTKTVFVPKVILLDGQYNITRVIDASIFHFEPAELLNDNQFSGTFTIDRSHYGDIHNETYMIIYTPEQELSASTSIDTDEMRYAKARALTTPRNAKENIPHAAWGNLHWKVEYLSDLNAQNNIYIPNPATAPAVQPAITAQTTVVHDDIQQPAMLKETEKYYNDQIRLAIKNNDIKKAVALYKEAKRLGSPTAEGVLIKSLE